jgi:predicted CXXCH cytochrome family protein
MRKLLAAALALVPAFALALVTNTAHDLTYTGNAIYVNGAPTYFSACSFCHAAHHTAGTRGLWVRRGNQQAAFQGVPDGRTTAGTVLATTPANLYNSRQCLSCHDGSVALNETATYGVDASGTITGPSTWGVVGRTISGVWTPSTVVGDITTTGAYLPSLNGTHPVSVPYPGTAVAGYYGIVTGTCATGIASCTAQSTQVSLKAQNTGTYTGAYTVECQSCHEVHTPGTSGIFLRSVTGGLCQACHNK